MGQLSPTRVKIMLEEIDGRILSTVAWQDPNYKWIKQQAIFHDKDQLVPHDKLWPQLFRSDYGSSVFFTKMSALDDFAIFHLISAPVVHPELPSHYK